MAIECSLDNHRTNSPTRCQKQTVAHSMESNEQESRSISPCSVMSTDFSPTTQHLVAWVAGLETHDASVNLHALATAHSA